MKRFLGLAMLATLVWATAGWCDDHSGQSHSTLSTSTTPIAMPKPGPETKALAALFEGQSSWSGNVEAGAMGPASKATTCKGKAMGRLVGDGFWYVMDVENIVGAGKDAFTWRGHVTVGYDMGTRSYRATSVDNAGTLAIYRGTLEGDKFVLESVEPCMMMGQPMDDRMTWEKTPAGTWNFKEELRPQGGEWKTFQTASMVTKRNPVKKGMVATGN